MANSGITIYQLPANTVSSGDLMVIVKNANTVPAHYKTPVDDVAAAYNTVSNAAIVIFTANTPANSTALSISQGVVFYDNNYLYCSTSNNVVKRVALSSF